MKTADIRQAFLDYFSQHGHTIVESSSLIPENDASLLFTNAGMVQFKEIFLGLESRTYVRAASSQRCVRAGGKHNDLENVGYTARHHTFFEMLGNFSFGDYFKPQAIRYAWDFLTQTLKLSPEKLWITIYQDDQESADIWLKEIGVSPAHFSRRGEKDNFWAMGDTGPCGPCTEIFYDHGPEIPGGPPGSKDEDGDRYVEIWNIVFMQYNRDASGTLIPLPKPSVDTGMGLERIAAVMQGVHSNYDIDLFQSLIVAAAGLVGVKGTSEQALKVLADHIRACSFLIVDGVVPSNEGQGYVLRRIMRRAIRYGYQLGQKDCFFYKLVDTLVKIMGPAHPLLVTKQAEIEEIIQQEEKQFARTLDQGVRLLDQAIVALKSTQLPGDIAFKLYDTYGFPVDLTADMLRQKNMTIDMAGFEDCMEEQRDRARAANHFQFQAVKELPVTLPSTVFMGYEALETESTVLALLDEQQQLVEVLTPGMMAAVILDKTPFYAEAGGQVGDKGVLQFTFGTEACQFDVLDTRRIGEITLHMGCLITGNLLVQHGVTARVEKTHRRPTARNHSATHLLHAALRTILGDRVIQKGSLVESQRLRFDFAFPSPVSAEQLLKIEQLVNQHIQDNTPVKTTVMPIEQAKSKGAMALFGEKYGDTVRVLQMGDIDFSVELCGGTHVVRTGDIGFFKIVSESGVAAGVRRIEALTGDVAVVYQQEIDQSLARIGAQFKVAKQEAETKVIQNVQKVKELEKQIERLEQVRVLAVVDQLAKTSGPVIQKIDLDPKHLRDAVTKLKEKIKPSIVVLAAVEQGKVFLAVAIGRNHSMFDAREMVNLVAEHIGGKGGGRPDFAQIGGQKPEGLSIALEVLKKYVQERLEKEGFRQAVSAERPLSSENKDREQKKQ
jgi:alanyl-tRNA synthetase